MTNLEIIRQIDFLASLNEKAISEIADKFKEINLSKGTVIFKENEPGDCFYVLKSGRVSLTKRINIDDEASGELIFFKPYEYFGELALIDDEPRSGTVTVTDDASLLKIDKDDFLAICKDHPTVLFSIVKTMSRRLRDTNDRYIKMWDTVIKDKKLAAIGAAASKIVHDIKTPITIIVLTAEVIEKLFEQVAPFTKKIIKQVRILDEMVREILEFARGEKSDLKISEIDLEQFFNEMLDELNPLAEVSKVKLTLVNNVKQRVFFDSMKIHHTIFNIFKNGIEAIGERKGKIDINAEIVKDQLHISIYNDGPEIPQQVLNQIFEPFATYGKKSGTGLGLAICHKVIKDHNGDMYAQNLKEGGVLFDIYIPMKKYMSN
ncbi:MAG: cyclic nucleotide-binding domain-containing protein [Candidatus Cloacimonetes bacterium]|nr:cyclic nucleotide-binding domain-containing protein [Candidatus Cloacimonadota bacterium]